MVKIFVLLIVSIFINHTGDLYAQEKDVDQKKSAYSKRELSALNHLRFGDKYMDIQVRADLASAFNTKCKKMKENVPTLTPKEQQWVEDEEKIPARNFDRRRKFESTQEYFINDANLFINQCIITTNYIIQGTSSPKNETLYWSVLVGVLLSDYRKALPVLWQKNLISKETLEPFLSFRNSQINNATSHWIHMLDSDAFFINNKAVYSSLKDIN